MKPTTAESGSPATSSSPLGPLAKRPGRGPLARAWSGLLRIFRLAGDLDLVWDPGYELPISGLAADPQRAKLIVSYLLAEGMAEESRIHRPQPVSYRLLRHVHDDDYLDSLRDPAALLPIIGVPVSGLELDAVLRLQRLAAGGTLLACQLATSRRGIAVNLSGGFHHAHRAKGAGFCVFNDVAVAVAELRAGGFGGRILIVDLDLHDGDGTRSLFARDPTVYTFTIHNRDWGPKAAIAATVIALGDDVDDELYVGTLRRRLPPVWQSFEPELVIYVAGADPAADDVLGNWRISPAGMLARDRFVLETARRHPAPLPVVIILGGGYGPSAWRHTARTLAWIATGRAIEPPSTEEMTIRQYREVARLFPRSALTGEGDPAADDWGLSDADLLGGGLHGMVEDNRLLGFYTPQGVEFALERTGFLDRLRRLGFPEPFVDVDLDNRAGQTLRVFADASRDELLCELRCRRDRQAVPGLELLALEWLLLQNPRGRFSAEVPPLPGQKHPGLGVLNDAIALMVLVCERLGLDGVSFVPSHYHLASKGRRFLRFADPRHEAELRALDTALRGLPLAEATRRVNAGEVAHRASGEAYHWHPMLMVLPVSLRLRERLDSDDYWQRERAAEGDFDFAVKATTPATVGSPRPTSPRGGRSDGGGT